MIPIEIPTDRVLNLKGQGFDNAQIIKMLQKENYSQQQIADALMQASMKAGVGSMTPPKSQINVPYPPVQGYQESEPLPQEDFAIEIPEPPIPPASMATAKKMKPVQSPQKALQLEETRERADRIEEIAESIIQEKWEELVKNIGNLTLWREKINTDTLSIKQELIRTQQRFENLEKAILGRITRYDENIRDIGSEMKALEKVFERIITPLTTNIKELTKITNELKKVKR